MQTVELFNPPKACARSVPRFFKTYKVKSFKHIGLYMKKGLLEMTQISREEVSEIFPPQSEKVRK